MSKAHPTEAGLKQAALRRGSLGQTFKAVAWSFFGVRNSRDNHVDFTELNPLHVVAVGIFSAALFVVSLIAVVGFVVGGIGQ